MSKPIPIDAAAKVCQQYGYDQIVIMARKVGGNEHVTTYGVDQTHCDVAARMGYVLKYRIMGWDERGRSECETRFTAKELSDADQIFGLRSPG